MFKRLKQVFRSSTFRGALGGMGSAAVAALGWKIASDVYDAVKKRVKEQDLSEARSEEEAQR